MFQQPTEYPAYKDGREYRTDVFAADGTTVLRRTFRKWEQPAAGSTWPLTQPETRDTAKLDNPQVTEVTTTLGI